MAEVIPLVPVVTVVTMLRVRCIGEELGDILGHHSLRCLIGEHVVLTWVALPVLCVLGELGVLKVLCCEVIDLLAVDVVLLIIVVILLVIILVVVEIVLSGVRSRTWFLFAWVW